MNASVRRRTSNCRGSVVIASGQPRWIEDRARRVWRTMLAGRRGDVCCAATGAGADLGDRGAAVRRQSRGYFRRSPRSAAPPLESIRDGSLIRHIGASLLRVGLGTLIGSRDRRSAGDRDGRQPGGFDVPDAAVSFLFGAGGHRVDPDRDAVVRLWLRRDHLCDLQRGVLRRRLQHAARRLDHPA